MENGNDKEAVRMLALVFSTFSRQYADNPSMAQEKYQKWVERRMDQIGRHPRIRQLSTKEQVDRLKKASDFAARERGKARTEMVQFLNNQLTMKRVRNLQKLQESNLEKKTAAPFEMDYSIDYDVGLGSTGVE